ncbi:MAG: TIGR04150 pseudo-rSAM protein [Tannerellaceae bacterium]|jgi:pseudo-rSAM protein|nr:TIGR04150 pseudo-rSAM protein [Tannerellaceae bacterium]
MISKKNLTNYWFTIEPYVYICITDNCILLYNTLDGVFIESDKIKVIELLREIVQEENCGVVLLTNEQFKQKEINDFIRELRGKYMGDVIDVDLSKGKPVQLLPFFNLSGDIRALCKKHNFASGKKILEFLSEISIYVDHSTNITNLIPFLQSLPGNLTINVVGNLENVVDYVELLSFLDQLPSSKNLICPCTNVISLQPTFENNFSYSVLVHFPVDMLQLGHSRQLLLNQTLPIEYVFEVSSLDDCQQAKQLVEQFGIEKYQLKPIYTGDNIDFFEENVFLTKEDILSTSMSIEDFFANQAMNIYDFWKVNVMPNGDIYANVNHLALGNICTHSIHEIIYKEVEEGKSWLRIRNQAPCSTCIYQWFCPPPSDYEIIIGRLDLCHVKQ